jgi:hypothetical protein
MLGFIIPFRAKSTSNKWEYHCSLLERTLKSVCNQKTSNFKVVLVYSDLPDFAFRHENLIFLHFPFQRLTVDEISDFSSYASKHYDAINAANVMDQGKKTLWGVKMAIESGCNYIMSVDADDLISSRIAGYVNINSLTNEAGWVINKGYVIFEGVPFLVKQPYKMNELNGSTHIVRSNIIPIPDFSSTNLWDYNFFAAHGWLNSRIKDEFNEKLRFLPFYGVLYSINPGSWTWQKHHSSVRGLRKFVKYFFLGRILTGKIRREFSYYPLVEK